MHTAGRGILLSATPPPYAEVYKRMLLTLSVVHLDVGALGQSEDVGVMIEPCMEERAEVLDGGEACCVDLLLHVRVESDLMASKATSSYCTSRWPMLLDAVVWMR